MAEVEQLLQHHQRIGAARVQLFEQPERAGRIAPHHRLEQVEDEAAVGDAEHVAHRRLGDRRRVVRIAGRERDRLVEQ